MAVTAPQTIAPAALQAQARETQALAFLANPQWKRRSIRVQRLPDASGQARNRFELVVTAEGAPANALKELLGELRRRSPVKSLVVNGETLEGPWYHRTALWEVDQRDPSRLVLLWYLSSGPVSEENVVEDGCSSVTSIRTEFDRESVEDLTLHVDYGKQGYVVRIGGRSRDPETGNYSYTVSVTRRKTKYTPDENTWKTGVLTGEDAVSKSYRSSISGVYGTKDAPVDWLGNPIPGIWDPHTAPQGTIVDVNWGRDESDCTLSVQMARRVAKTNVTVGESCEKDQFHEADNTRVAGVAAKLGHAPEPAAGLSQHYDSSLKADGTWETGKTQHQERKVEQASVSSSATVFGSRSTRLDRSTDAIPPVASAGGGVGISVGVEKTPGVLRNINVQTETELPFPDVVVTVQKDLFGTRTEHRDHSMTAAPPDPVVGAGVSGSSSSQVRPLGGIDGTRSTNQENRVPDAQVVIQDDLFNRVEHRTVRSDSDVSDPEAAFGGGQIISGEKARTPGDLAHRTRTLRIEKPVAGAQVSVDATIYTRTRRVVDVGQVPAEPVATAGAGVLISKSSRLSPAGNASLGTDTREELPVPTSSLRTVITPWLRRRTTTDTQMMEPFLAPDYDYGTIEHQISPGGRYNRSKSSIVPGSIVPGYVLSCRKGGDLFSTYTVTRTIEVVKEYGQTGLIIRGAGLATIREVDFDSEEEGYFIKTETLTTVTPEVFISTSKVYFDTERQLTITLWDYKFVNADPGKVLAIYTSFSAEGALQLQHSFDLNRFGLMTGAFSYRQVLVGA